MMCAAYLLYKTMTNGGYKQRSVIHLFMSTLFGTVDCDIALALSFTYLLLRYTILESREPPKK